MDTQHAAIYSLPPELSHHVLKHLCKRDKQQFSICCKHMYVCALAAIRSLILSHKCLASGKTTRLKTRKYCTCVTLRPRTMDELTKLASLLLVHNMHHLPALTCIRLELLNVYDKQCDVSLIIKSIVLHSKQLTQLVIEEEAQVSLKGLAATAELPMLERLEIRTRKGFEPGALGQLSRAVNVSQLHLEILPEVSSSSSTPLSPAAAAAAGPAKSPSELARLQAADEVGLAKMASQMLSLTAVGFACASAGRPVSALLAAVAGIPKPRLTELALGGQELPGSSINIIASIASLVSLKLLPGCDLASPMDLARLSSLTGLTQLQVAPLMPPAPVLAAWAKGCKHLVHLGVCGQPGPLPLTPAMPGITSLQLMSSSGARSRHGSSTGASSGSPGSSGPGSLSLDLGSLAITLHSPLSLTGIDSLWPKLVSLEVCGWALDAGSISAIKQLEGLAHINLQGGRDPGTALHARLLLPLLDKPGLSKLVLRKVSDLSDTWLAEAMQHITGPTSDSTRPAVRELHLGAAHISATAPTGSSSNTGSPAGSPLKASGGSGSSWSPSAFGDSLSGDHMGSSGGSSSSLLTDRGLVKLVAWPGLSTLVLSGLPGISLAGLKALVAGCPSLAEVTVRDCPAVGVAPPDSLARAAVGPSGRVVDLWVS